MPAISASAPGKTILFGEHAVVFGYPAIAVPLTDISLTVIVQPLPNEKKIHIMNEGLGEDFILEDNQPENSYSFALETIRKYLEVSRLPAMRLTIASSIPQASGLGSSAAFAVAITKAVVSFLGFRLTLEKLNEIAFQIEKNQHGTPSGIDNTVVSYQKPLFFRKDQPIEFIKLIKPLTLILGDSGVPSLTREAVTQVREMRETDPDTVNPIIENIGRITEDAKAFIESGDHGEIGRLMLYNHQQLKKLDISMGVLDQMVEAAVQSGAYGAKLCGSGKGGNVVALIPLEKTDSIKEAMVKAGAQSCMVSTIAISESIL